MNWSWWSDEDRWFLPRRLGLGYSLNLKYAAKRLGWIRSKVPVEPTAPTAEGNADVRPESREDRLRRQADESRYEAGQ